MCFYSDIFLALIIFLFYSHLRFDTLAQMLTLGNIHAGSKIIVFETCAGLVLGSVMERMGGIQFFLVIIFLIMNATLVNVFHPLLKLHQSLPNNI